MIKLTDVIQVEPNPEFAKLSIKEKNHLIDSLMTEDAATKKQKGLALTLRLSSSFRRINNRIYTSYGQELGLPTWTEPYPKPLIKNHDMQSEPLGRFNSLSLVSLDKQASTFFKNVSDFTKFKGMLDSKDPKKIYKALHSNRLLTNPQWSGTHALVGKVNVVDADAIEKFLDGRYLTFSSGAYTDAMICSLCGTDWGKGSPCDHMPGTIDEDGEIAVFITGNYFGREVSVLNNPADSLSQVISMEMVDSLDSTHSSTIESWKTDESTIYLSDSLFDLGDFMKKEKLTLEDASTEEASVEVAVVEDAKVLELPQAMGSADERASLADSLDGETPYELNKLIQFHDSLHHMYDFDVKWGESTRLPTDVFKLHAKLHQTLMAKDARGSMMNGHLDEYSAEGEKDDSFVIKMPQSTEDTVGAAVVEETKTVDFSSVDWDLVSIALDGASAREDATLLEQVVDKEIWPNVVIKTKAHLVALDRIVNSPLFAEDQKNVLLTKKMELEKELKDSVCEKCASVLKDYQESLSIIEQLKTELKSFSQEVVKKTTDSDKLNEVVQTFGSVENPLNAKLEDKVTTFKKPSGNTFEDSVTKTYLSIKDKSGDVAAERYIQRLQRNGYLSPKFNLNTLLES